MTMTPEEKIVYNKETRKKLKKFWAMFDKNLPKLSLKTILHVFVEFQKAHASMKKVYKKRMLEPVNKDVNRKLYEGFAKAEAKTSKLVKRIRDIMRAEALS